MKIFPLLVAISGLAVCGASRADDTPAKSPSRVDVTYVYPKEYTNRQDVFQAPDAKYYLSMFEQHIKSLAGRHISADQHLAVRITELDLAGKPPWTFDRFRIIRENDPPHIALDFVLVGPDGKTIKQGHRNLVDLNFLAGINTYPEEDPLRYEKPMLDDWFEAEFGPART